MAISKRTAGQQPLHIIIQGLDSARLCSGQRPAEANSERQTSTTACGAQQAGLNRVMPASGIPLPVTFDSAYENLERISKLFIEPDGAFLWMGRDQVGEEQWRLDGCLYDGGGQLQYVELKGHGGWTNWREILLACGASNEGAMIQHVREGRFQSLEQFQRLVEAGSGAN